MFICELQTWLSADSCIDLILSVSHTNVEWFHCAQNCLHHQLLQIWPFCEFNFLLLGKRSELVDHFVLSIAVSKPYFCCSHLNADGPRLFRSSSLIVLQWEGESTPSVDPSVFLWIRPIRIPAAIPAILYPQNCMNVGTNQEMFCQKGNITDLKNCINCAKGDSCGACAPEMGLDENCIPLQ
jgi:hypothetical protein